MKFLIKGSLIVLTAAVLAGCHFSSSVDGNYVMVTSVSSDGHYAVTTNMNQHVYLWDLQNKTYKDIDSSVNIYSAYFIKNSDNFMYQKNGSNKVIIENVSGDIVKEFNPGFATYGDAITSNLQTWIGADKFFQLYVINNGQKKQVFYYWCGPNYKDHRQPPKGMPYGCASFMGGGKLFNINILPNEKRFVTTDGGSNFYLWSLPDGKQLQKLHRNVGQTVNAISPNGKYVIVGDQQFRGLKYNLSTNKFIKFFYGTEGLPADADDQPSSLIAIKFIDANHLIATMEREPNLLLKGVLYDINRIVPVSIKTDEPWATHQLVAQKYLPLISKNFNLYVNQTKPYPETTSFVRDQAMDTSPSAHVLVMGQANRGGIMVYKYNPEDKTLKLVWSPTLETPQSN